MEPPPAVAIAFELIQSDHQILGRDGFVAIELQDGTILAAEYRQATRRVTGSPPELNADFDLAPLWGAHPDGIRTRARELGIAED